MWDARDVKQRALLISLVSGFTWVMKQPEALDWPIKKIIIFLNLGLFLEYIYY